MKSMKRPITLLQSKALHPTKLNKAIWKLRVFTQMEYLKSKL